MANDNDDYEPTDNLPDTGSNGYNVANKHREQLADAVLALPKEARPFFTSIGSFLLGYRLARHNRPNQRPA